MDPVKAQTVYKSFWRGVRKTSPQTGFSFYSVGFDTETKRGKVFALGFHTEKGTYTFHGLKRNYPLEFVGFLARLKNLNSVIVCGAHYLIYDLMVIFAPLLNPYNSKMEKSPRSSEFSMIQHRATIEIHWGKPRFASVKFLTESGKVSKVIHIIDTFAFFTMSLERALETFGTGKVKKLGKPKGLGKRVIPKRELMPYFEADLKGVWELLEVIKIKHLTYRVPLCVSLPMMSGRIFRQDFMKADFPKSDFDLLDAALLSYHGGKNTFNGKPGWYQNAYDLDVRSAFPEAMRQLPNFESGSWRSYISGKSRMDRLPSHGIYKISGRAGNCPWGSLFSHAFKRLQGEFNDIWTTSYELNESLESGEVVLSSVSGFYFEDDRSEGPFKRFVDYFYHQKESARTPAEREFFKLILNSLYGKFVARQENDDGEMEAGSMFDPAIASLITGFVRAKIHRLEHKYNSIHTATDGLVTIKKPDPKDLGPNLGQLKLEVFGPCLILRNKLYLHYDESGKLVKKGLHGFEGKAEDLLKMYSEERKYYRIERLASWAESWKIGIPPGTPISRKRVLNYSKS